MLAMKAKKNYVDVWVVMTTCGEVGPWVIFKKREATFQAKACNDRKYKNVGVWHPVAVRIPTPAVALAALNTKGGA